MICAARWGLVVTIGGVGVLVGLRRCFVTPTLCRETHQDNTHPPKKFPTRFSLATDFLQNSPLKGGTHDEKWWLSKHSRRERCGDASLGVCTLLDVEKISQHGNSSEGSCVCVLRVIRYVHCGRCCCCLQIKPFFLPNGISSTPSVRPDSSS